jgi:hypothetical protein
MSDEFYVGYESEISPRIARHVRRVAVALVAVALVLPGVLVVAHRKFASAEFEFGRTRPFEGRLVATPYPALSTTDASGTTRLYWLVAPGKHGAGDLVSGVDGALARVTGTVIQRDDDAMLQVELGGIEVQDEPADAGVAAGGSLGDASRALQPRGSVTLTGEIVDSKCHLGVMKPGEGPTHRDCAVRCLLGGLPPMFVPRDGTTTLGRLAIVTREGRALTPDALMRVVGKPVEVQGTLFERAGQRFLGLAPEHVAVEHAPARNAALAGRGERVGRPSRPVVVQ